MELRPALAGGGAGRRVQMAVKRGLDLLLAVAALIALSPLLLGTGLAIRLTSPGPVLISQLRDGRNGAVFHMWKFRTMYAELGDPAGIRQTTADDARITPVGRWLRRRSIDELPQLYNIVVGDMAIVGPRPHPVGMYAAGRRYDELVPYYHHRHVVRPGLSGWAQCNGLRGPTVDEGAARARIDHDLAYIQNFSLLLDLRIIWRTLLRELLIGTGS